MQDCETKVELQPKNSWNQQASTAENNDEDHNDRNLPIPEFQIANSKSSEMQNSGIFSKFEENADDEKNQIQNRSAINAQIATFYRRNSNLIELTLALIFTIILPIFISPVLLGNDSENSKEVLFTIAVPLAMFLGMAIGGNDICNGMGASFGSKTLSMKQCIILGCIFESLGAMLLGQNVSKTIGTRILDPVKFNDDQVLFIVAMVTILGATAFASLCVTIYGLPVSITHSIIFSMTTVGIFSLGWDSIKKQEVANIFIALISSPVIGIIISFIIYLLIIKLIKQQKDPKKASMIYIPIFGFLSVYSVSHLVFSSGINLEPAWLGNAISLGLSLMTSIILFIYNQKKKHKIEINALKQLDQEQNCDDIIQDDFQVQNIFRPLLVITGCCVSFTHGANDIGNCAGPLSIVYSFYKHGQQQADTDIPFFTLALGSIAFSAGIILIGKRTIKTFGQSVTAIDPMKGFAVQFATTGAILISTVFGMPVSTSHCAIGSIVGSTLAEFVSKEPYRFSKDQFKKILASWLYTIPFIFVITVMVFYAFKVIYLG